MAYQIGARGSLLSKFKSQLSATTMLGGNMIGDLI